MDQVRSHAPAQRQRRNQPEPCREPFDRALSRRSAAAGRLRLRPLLERSRGHVDRVAQMSEDQHKWLVDIMADWIKQIDDPVLLRRIRRLIDMRFEVLNTAQVGASKMNISVNVEGLDQIKKLRDEFEKFSVVAAAAFKAASKGKL